MNPLKFALAFGIMVLIVWGLAEWNDSPAAEHIKWEERRRLDQESQKLHDQQEYHRQHKEYYGE